MGLQGDMTGKTVLIAGTTDGIGKETARQLAAMGARELIHGRCGEKADRVRKAIIQDSGNDQVDVLIADLAEMEHVRSLEREAREKLDYLDVLINKAGVYGGEFVRTSDGFERTFAVNHLAYFLLSNLLLDQLKQSAPARIITVNSSAHGSARLDLENLNAEKKFHG